jgi:8-oxo-dGTP pyrophosphatase MutT (NUDIX family)
MQSAALPYRATSEGSLEVLLVTSRKRRRRILPKGKVAAGMLPHRSAAREAMEEAGVVGTPDDAPVGELFKRKKAPDGGSQIVRVYPLRVSSEMERWPEHRQRERRWVSLEQALELVADNQIRKVSRRFAGLKSAATRTGGS